MNTTVQIDFNPAPNVQPTAYKQLEELDNEFTQSSSCSRHVADTQSSSLFPFSMCQVSSFRKCTVQLQASGVSSDSLFFFLRAWLNPASCSIKTIPGPRLCDVPPEPQSNFQLLPSSEMTQIWIQPLYSDLKLQQIPLYCTLPSTTHTRPVCTAFLCFNSASMPHSHSHHQHNLGSEQTVDNHLFTSQVLCQSLTADGRPPTMPGSLKVLIIIHAAGRTPALHDLSAPTGTPRPHSRTGQSDDDGLDFHSQKTKELSKCHIGLLLLLFYRSHLTRIWSCLQLLHRLCPDLDVGVLKAAPPYHFRQAAAPPSEKLMLIPLISLRKG